MLSTRHNGDWKFCAMAYSMDNGVILLFYRLVLKITACTENFVQKKTANVSSKCEQVYLLIMCCEPVSVLK